MNAAMIDNRFADAIATIFDCTGTNNIHDANNALRDMDIVGAHIVDSLWRWSPTTPWGTYADYLRSIGLDVNDDDSRIF